MPNPYYVEARPIEAPPRIQPEGPHEELFDWAMVRRYILFSLGSVRRRLWLFLLVSGGMVALTALALAQLPKTYEVQTDLLVQKNAVLAVRADSNQLEQPTRAASEIITRTENLRSLIQTTGLLDEWPKKRTLLQRAKDWVMLELNGPTSQTDLLEHLTEFLRKNVDVWTTGEGGVTIRVHWPDAMGAYRLADTAEQGYLESRHVLEVSTIAEQLSILERHAEQVKKDVDGQVAELKRLRQNAAPRRKAPAPAAAPVKPVDPEVINLRVVLDGKRRAIADLEELRRRHILELQTRLAEQRAVYSENNPMVVDLEQTIESLQKDSPQLQSLRDDAADLQRKLAKAGATEEPPGRISIPQELFQTDPSEDSSVEYARAQLRFNVAEYASLHDRIANTRIDLDTAQAAFKYRYSIVVPPEVPRGPIKPKTPVVIAASVVVGLLLALFATTIADLRAGRLIEPWQLEKVLPPTCAIVPVQPP